MPVLHAAAGPEQGTQQQSLRSQIEHRLVFPQRLGQFSQNHRQKGRPQSEQHPGRRQQEPVAAAEQAGGQQQQLQRQGKAPKRGRPPVLLYQHRQQGQAGPHHLPGEYEPEPIQSVPHRQIADEADQGGAAVQDVLSPANPPEQGQVLFCQGFRVAGLHVLAGSEQLMLADAQHRADIPDQGDVGIGHAPLPLAHRRLGYKELIGKFLLGQTQPLPAAADIRAKGLLVFHMQPSFAVTDIVVPQGVFTIRHPGAKGKLLSRICASTVRKVLIPQGFPPLPGYFLLCLIFN